MALDMPSLVALFCLLLLPHLSNCNLTNGTEGTRHFLFRASSLDAQPSPKSTSCSSIPSGFGNNKLPVVHRHGPCSPLGGTPEQDRPTAILHRDSLRLGSLYQTHADAVSSTASSSSVTIPDLGTPSKVLPGILDYTVVVGYGTPVKNFSVAFDTNVGFSLIQCQAPCTNGSCSQQSGRTVFDPSQSSSFASIPCGSPECPIRGGRCAGPSCTATFRNATAVLGNGTFAKETLTLVPSTIVKNFTFVCAQLNISERFGGAEGVISLSRNNLSAISQASPVLFGGIASFSYCLPSSTSSTGFLSLGAPRPEYYSGRNVKYVPMVNNSIGPNFYFVELIGLTVGGTDLPIPPTVFTANGTIIDSTVVFTYFTAVVYSALRDEFRKQMTQFPMAPPFNSLDTCYNFTGLHVISAPIITLKFGGGVTVEPDFHEIMYFLDPSNVFSVGCLAFAATPDQGFPISVIGNLVQRSTEVIYDVQGGKIGLIQGSC